MLISKITANCVLNNFSCKIKDSKVFSVAMPCDSVSFSSKIQDKKPELKEKTIYIFLGAPASGKGTQAQQLAHDLNIAHISTGDMLRNEIKNETKLGQEAQEYINKGELVPTDLFKKLLIDRIGEPDCQNGFILDGFPRSEEQAIMIDELNQEDSAKIKVIQLVVDENKLMDRMLSRAKIQNRADDTPEKLQTRIKVYNAVRDTLLNYYNDSVVNIDGNKDIKEVRKQITDNIQEDLI